MKELDSVLKLVSDGLKTLAKGVEEPASFQLSAAGAARPRAACAERGGARHC